MKISRDGRRVKDHLEAKTGLPISPLDLFKIESLVYSFYTKFICESIDKYYNPKSKKNFASIDFYAKPIRSMNKSRKENTDWEITDDGFQKFFKISNFLVDDYNQEQQKLVKEMTEIANLNQITRAIESATQEKVYNVNYLHRVLQGVIAVDDHHRAKVQKRRELFIEGPVDDITNKRPMHEIVGLVADFFEEIENININKKLKSLEDKR